MFREFACGFELEMERVSRKIQWQRQLVFKYKTFGDIIIHDKAWFMQTKAVSTYHQKSLAQSIGDLKYSRFCPV